MIPPARFIPLFEKNGAIGKLDEYMFTCVCAQLSQWRQEGVELRPVSVNLSRASLCRQGSGADLQAHSGRDTACPRWCRWRLRKAP